ncbi:MAG: hypothetical protein ABR590_01925 [Spirochaetia bacterium]
MKKAVLFIALLGIMAVALASAQSRGFWSDEESEPLSISGSAIVDDWGRVAIESGNETYHLMPAFAIPESAEIASGDTVEVTGYEMPGPRFGVDEGDSFIRASEVTVGGRTYVLDSGSRGGHMGRGGSSRRGGDDFSRTPQGRDDFGRNDDRRSDDFGRAPRR